MKVKSQDEVLPNEYMAIGRDLTWQHSGGPST